MESPILVTGSPRSGTTWIGKMINLSQQVGYLHETYNVMIKQNLPGEDKPNQFCLITDDNEDHLRESFNRIVNLQYSFSDLFGPNKSVPNFFHSLITHFKFARYRRNHLRPLLKDPFVIFNVEWMVENFDITPIILIRHPAPIYDSFHRLHWPINFDRLLRDLPDSVEREIIQNSGLLGSKVEPTPQVIGTLWSAIHRKIMTYQQDHPDWLFLRYEDIFLNLETNFKTIFEYLDLEISDETLSKIYFYTSRGYFPSEKSQVDSHISRSNLLTGWRRRVSDADIQLLQDQVESHIYNHYYTDENWNPHIDF